MVTFRDCLRQKEQSLAAEVPASEPPAYRYEVVTEEKIMYGEKIGYRDDNQSWVWLWQMDEWKAIQIAEITSVTVEIVVKGETIAVQQASGGGLPYNSGPGGGMVRMRRTASGWR